MFDFYPLTSCQMKFTMGRTWSCITSRRHQRAVPPQTWESIIFIISMCSKKGSHLLSPSTQPFINWCSKQWKWNNMQFCAISSNYKSGSWTISPLLQQRLIMWSPTKSRERKITWNVLSMGENPTLKKYTNNHILYTLHAPKWVR